MGATVQQPSDQEMLVRISEQIMALDSKHDRMDRRIFGNGQPGEFGVVHARLDRIRHEVSTIDDRVDKLENWRWYVMGASAGFGAIGAMIGFYVGLAQ